MSVEHKLTSALKYIGVFLAGFILSALLGPFVQPLRNLTQPLANRLMPRTLQITSEEFTSWYRGQENKAEAEELAKIAYYGKYIEWTGIVSEISVVNGEPRVNWGIKETQAGISASFILRHSAHLPSLFRRLVHYRR